MAERTYRFGYAGERCTLAQLNLKWTWVHLHPEVRRRLVRMFDHAQDAGYKEVGIGEGARSTDVQRATFLARHSVVTSGGCCVYLGKRYQLRQGMAHAAPPGSSVHEDGLLQGYALAADLIGWENHWFDKNCSRYALKNFGGAVGPNVNGEEWHFQPQELGNSRSTIQAQIKAGAVLTIYNLPGEPTPPTVPTTPPKGYRVLATADQIVAVEAPRWDARGYGYLVGQHGIGFEGGAGQKMIMCAITVIGNPKNTQQGYATAWSGLYPAPNHSFTNYNPGETETGFVLSHLAPDGTFMVYLSQPAMVFADIMAYAT